MSDFLMPRLGADMESGKLVEWLKQPGDPVARGDLVADVETDKGVITIEAFQSGILDRHVAQIGDDVPVGGVLAILREAASLPPETTAPETTAPTVAATVPDAQEPKPLVAPPASQTSLDSSVGVIAATASPAERLPMSPSARRLARELGVDPHEVQGTGPGLAITRDDIQRAADAKSAKSASSVIEPAAPPPSKPPVDADHFNRMRQTIAAAMTRSKREIPHYYLSTTIDMQAATMWVAAENERRAVADRLLVGALLLKAVALALRKIPELNAVWEGDVVVKRPDIHVGTAIALRTGGLIAPALMHADQKTLDQLMTEFRDLVSRTRGGGLRSTELSESTITVTSLGETGVEAVFGVIYPPQVAIVGFGKIVERPWSIDGEIFSRPVVVATLSADHRVTDGHRGSLFLSEIDRLLQEPHQL